jgi:hypothetical protein
VAKWPSLTVPVRDAPQVRARDEGMAAAVEQRNRTRRRTIRAFGRGTTPASKRGPDARTMDQVRPQSGSWQQTTLTLDKLADLSSSNPIRWQPIALTPDRSKSPAKGCRKWKKGLTNQGPLQKRGLSTRVRICGRLMARKARIA